MTSDRREYAILLNEIANSFNRELSALSSEYNN